MDSTVYDPLFLASVTMFLQFMHPVAFIRSFCLSNCWVVFYYMNLLQFTCWKTSGLISILGLSWIKLLCTELNWCTFAYKSLHRHTLGDWRVIFLKYVHLHKKWPNCFPKRVYHTALLPVVCDNCICSRFSTTFDIINL